MKRCIGFTLIELLVVIGLITMLMAALLPHFGAVNDAAKSQACDANLRWWFETIQGYRTTHREWPEGEGSALLRTVWNSTSIEKTEPNLERCFCPHLAGDGKKRHLLAGTDIDDLWRNGHDTADIDYACRKDRRNWERGKVAWMADDNDDGRAWNHASRSMNVLYGDGNVHLFTLEELVDKGVLTADESADLQAERSDLVLQCGPQSRLPDLRDLRY
ncbi:MAG: type II secretion system protein [Planctomycetota bacterium]